MDNESNKPASTISGSNKTSSWFAFWKVVRFIFKMLFKIFKIVWNTTIWLLVFCLEAAGGSSHREMSLSDRMEMNRMQKQIKKLNKKVADQS